MLVTGGGVLTMSDISGRRPRRRGGPLGHLVEHVEGLFTPRTPVPDDQRLSARLLNGLILAAFPVLLTVVVMRLVLGIRLAETANLTLLALAAFGLLAALILRSGRVHLSASLFTFALWVAGTFISWMYFGMRDPTAFIPLFAIQIAFILLPWHAGVLLTVLSISSIWLQVALKLQGFHRPDVASPVDAGFTFTAILILISLLAFVFGRILHRAVQQTIEAQQAMTKSQEELSSILERTPDIIYRLDAEGRITYVNEAVRRYGYDPSEMVGTYLFDYVHPQDREMARHCACERRTGDRSTRALEIRFLTAQGKEKVAEYTAVPVFLLQAEGLYENGTGAKHFVGTQGIARDITDRKRAEESLKKSEEKYSKMFRAAPAGVSVAGLDDARFVDVNEEFERIFGYRRDELIGHSALDLGFWADPGERERVANLLKRGEMKDLELQCRAKNRELRTVRYNAQLIDIEGSACLLSAIEDITERRRLESQLQQAQKLEALGRLAGGIAHDFNNMLAVILGQAEMAAGDLAPASPAYESIQEIRKAAEHSANLTRQLLVFARKQDLAPRSLDLNRAISERLGMLRRLMGENIVLNWDPDPGLWPVKMDPVQIDQILINLSVNARDAIVDVGTLSISTGNRLRKCALPENAMSESSREWVLMTVADTGTGMSDETLAHIFEPFFTTKEIGKGTGMGLATVYGIVQHNGGWIEAESELGKGTTFRIYLPKTYEAVMSAHEADQSRMARGHETILVVEDEPAILKIIRTTLQRLGYTVIEAGSARDALAAAARHDGSLDLLLTDVTMPEMSGRDLGARIAVSHPGIRVIYMSGYSSDIREKDFAFLQKPFTMQQLSKTVREVLDKDKNERE